MLQRIARFHPFLILLGFTVVSWSVWAVLKADYDDGGVGTILFVLSMALGAPFLALRRIMNPLDQHVRPEFLTVVSALITASLYVAADRILSRLARRRAHHSNAGA